MADDFKELQLETDRLILKRAHYKLHAEEINAVVCTTIDSLEPYIAWAIGQPTVEETQEGLIRVTGDPKDYAFRLYLKDMSNPGSNKTSLIGMCGVIKQENVCEVGYWCHKAYTRKGYMSEALDRILKFSTEELKVMKYILLTHQHNIGSCKLAEKFGFQVNGSELFQSKFRPAWGEFRLLRYEKDFS